LVSVKKVVKVGASRFLGRRRGRGFPRQSIPQAELDLFSAQIFSRPEYLDTNFMCEAYRSLGWEVLPDPFDPGIPARVKSALETATPFSIVRIGDGEANILAFEAYADTPYLDRHAFEETVAGQSDTCMLDELWMTVLKEMMENAVATADVVGVLGLWVGGDGAGDAGRFQRHFLRDPRGVAGQWRGRDLMLRWARERSFNAAVLASAHLYLGVLAQLEELADSAREVVCISDRAAAVAALRARFPEKPVTHLPVGGARRRKGGRQGRPDFLLRTREALPADLRGRLCLVGAGPWAKIYCGWIKRRGGVAVDLGSGFDLLEGKLTRSIHKELPQELLSRLSSIAV
jgi:hypothetical protein